MDSSCLGTLGVTKDVKIVEEISGPAVMVLKFENEEEAVAISNSSPYSLTSWIYTMNEDGSGETARKIDPGLIFFTHYLISAVGIPLWTSEKGETCPLLLI